jgi:type IV secretory pathway TraG/TraD family ATPase VirD4
MIMLDMVSVSSLLLGVTVSGAALYGMINHKDTENKVCRQNELKSLSGNGIRCSQTTQLSVKQSNEHILAIMPSGSGKSRRVIMPNVNTLQNCSIICTDPNGEIERTCKPIKKKYILNPFCENTIGYDPLLNCHSEFEVRKIANVMLINGMNANSSKSSNSNQQDFVGMATPLLTSYMLMNYYTKKYTFADLIQNICTLNIIPIIAEKDSNGKPTKVFRSIQQEIMESGVESAIIEFESFKQVMGAIQTLSSIRIVMNSCLQVFLDKNVKKIFNRQNFDISKIRKEESIIYIQIPEHHADYFSPLTATFLTQMFDHLLENNGLQCYFLLDEFCNNGVIPSIGKLLSTARKHDISILAAVQSLNQIYNLYGELLGKELNELFKTLLVSAGLRDSAEYISNLLGNITRKDKDNALYTQPLMSSDELRRMDKDDILIICNNKRPVIDKMMNIVVG